MPEIRVKREIGMAPPDWRAAALACNLALVELLGGGDAECRARLHDLAETIQNKDLAAREQAREIRRLAKEDGLFWISPIADAPKLTSLGQHLEALCRALGLPEAR